MSRKANPTVIGSFVLGAAALAVGALLFFGTTKLFTRTKTFVCFFQESVAGLQVGSAVKFKGVPIGQVTEIQMRYEENKPAYIKILFEVNADRFVNSLGGYIDIFNEDFNRRQIQKGLRGTLAYESFITGQLYLEIDYHADAPPPEMLETNNDYTEIPTLSSNIEAIVEEAQKAVGKLGKIDFEKLSVELDDLLVTARKGIADVQLDQLSASIRNAADSITKLSSSSDLKDALTSVSGAFNRLSAALDTLQPRIGPMTDAVTPDLVELRKTLVELQKATASLNSALAPEGDLRYQLGGTLSQLDQMAKSLQQLSEFLTRNPNSLLFGRKPAPALKQ